MPILAISVHSAETAGVSIPSDIPRQFVRLGAYSVSFHDKYTHERIENDYNTIVYVKLPWITNRQSVVAKSNSLDERGVAPASGFLQGAVPLLLETHSGGHTLRTGLVNIGFDLHVPIPSSFDVGIYVKNIDNEIVKFTHNTSVSVDGDGNEVRVDVPAYCKVHMIWIYESSYTI